MGLISGMAFARRDSFIENDLMFASNVSLTANVLNRAKSPASNVSDQQPMLVTFRP